MIDCRLIVNNNNNYKDIQLDIEVVISNNYSFIEWHVRVTSGSFKDLSSRFILRAKYSTTFTILNVLQFFFFNI